MKRRITRVLIALLMLIGLSLLLYPLVANTWNNYRQKQIIISYESKVENAAEEGQIDYLKEHTLADNYNSDLLPSILPDSFAVAQAEDENSDAHQKYLACLNLAGDGVMGTVNIPKIGIRLPIFHTTTEEVLEIGAGHLEGSSLPVGGADTHCVISAHRGLPSASLFTDLDKLEIGDNFFISVLDQNLAYEVDQILVTEPEDTSSLVVEKGQDFVTLLTCTPYGVNTQRLMVRGHRVEYTPELMEESQTPLAAFSLRTSYLLWVLVGLGVTGLFIFILFLIDKRRRRKMENS